METLEHLLLLYNPHIAVVTETWLHDHINDCEIVPPSYKILRKDRGSRGGGVALIYKNYLSCILMPECSFTESLWCRVKFGGHSIVIGGVYRSPDSSPQFLENIYDYLQENVTCRSKIIIAGDFNLPSVKWDQLDPGVTDVKSGELLLDIAFSNNLSQVVQEFTRITDSSRSILDLIFVSESLKNYEVVVEDGLSDHKLVLLSIKLTAQSLNANCPTTEVYDYSRADDVSILDHLEISLSSFVDIQDVNQLWNQFKKIIRYCLDKFVPKKVKRVAKQNPWVTREIIHLKRRIARQRKKKPRNKTTIQEISRILKDKLKSAKERYFTEVMPEFIRTSPRRFWRHLAPSRDSVQYVAHDNHVITDPGEMANSFNDFFQSVFLDNCDLAENAGEFSHESHSNMPELQVTEEGIFALLLDMDTKKAVGPDEIPNTFLRRYAEWVSKYLFVIFSASLVNCEVPLDWLSARVVPVYKSGDKHSVENYRPISLTCACCKLLEHIVSKELFKFLEHSNIFLSNQHGFRKSLSTVTQLTETLHDFATSMNNRGQIDALCLDLSKAFDRVPHPELINKLLKLGINHKVILWIKAYLTNRKQFVEISKTNSCYVRVPSGVPQGSVLGPVLFLCYINDIVENIGPSIAVRLFADDCLLYSVISCHDDQVRLNSALQTVEKWCKESKMKINLTKTIHCTITNKKQNILPFVYKLGNEPLVQVNEFKYLGLTISSNLSWKTHVDNVCSAARKKLWYLKRNLKLAPPETRLTAYKALIRPTLEYASIIWDPFRAYQINKLEKIQRMAARFILSRYQRTESVQEMLNYLNLPTLCDRRKIARLKFFYMLQNGQFNFNTDPYIVARQIRPLRGNHLNHYQIDTANIDAYKYSFFPRTITDWNSLPQELTTANTLTLFEKSILNLFQ